MSITAMPGHLAAPPRVSARLGVPLLVFLFIIATGTAASGDPGRFCARGGDGNIATIAWKERSDWINVMTDVRPAARGDGRADDSAAIQAALDRIGPDPGDPKVVYLPPGTYRITRTLSITRREGGMVLGHGAATVLRWDGEYGARMLWSNGASRQSYIGLVWDGDGKAGVGIDHDSRTLYETRVLHEQMEFRNFTLAGIRVGHRQKLASAEMLFSNLKFVNNRNGALFQDWNDYNNVFDGCQFEDNETGIRAEKGNVVVRNSRFERSRETDLFLSTHSHSVRRVVSSGSRAFITTVRGPVSAAPLRVQDVLVTGWTDPDGAIVTDLRGPLLAFDVSFARPPNDAPPIRLNNPPYMNQLALISNVRSGNTTEIVASNASDGVYSIPSSVGGGSSLRADQVFLHDSYPVSTDIIDIRTDCGARGDGTRDDTGPIQRCLDLAREKGADTTVYFPSGYYRVTRSLTVPEGSAFRIDGTGWHSRIVRSGRPGEPVLHVHNPDGLSITHLALGATDDGITLLQTGSRPATARYHNVYGYHDDERKPAHMVFDGLPSGTRILADHIDGRILVRDSTEADILFGFVVSVQMTLEGGMPGTGLTGVLSRVSALADYPLVIRGSQNLIQTDWYNEQTPHLLLLQGMDEGRGEIILDHTAATTTDPVLDEIRGFGGTLVHIGGLLGHPDRDFAQKILAEGSAGASILMAGNMFWNRPPEFSLTGKGAHLIGNLVQKRRSAPLSTVPDQVDTGTYGLYADALDRFRRLGAADLQENYCVSTRR